MVDTSLSTNGRTRVIPVHIRLTEAESKRIPAPGTQRALKAETGRAWDVMVGPDADSADRIQTMIWIQLRRTIPDLRWDECADIDVDIDEGVIGMDPTKPVAYASSPHSADSGD